MAKKVKEPKENQTPKKKRDWKKTAIIVVVVIVVLCVIGMFMPSEEKEESEAQVAEVETEAEISDEYQWDPGELAYLGMDRAQLLEIYTDYENSLNDESGWELEGDEYLEWQDAIEDQIAEKYGISNEDVRNIFVYGSDTNYFATFDVDNVKLNTGEVIYALVNGGVIVVQARTNGLWNDKQTVEQNYFNAAYFIQKYIGDDDTYDKFEYWAVGPMTDGSEQKYISFTIPASLFSRIKNQTLLPKDFPDYVEDLWLLPSLREE